MIQITPIRERDGDQLHREFFTPEFIAYRLGRPGQWQGSAADKLGLSKAVEPEVFANLLQGRSAAGESLLRNPGRLSGRIPAHLRFVEEELDYRSGWRSIVGLGSD